MAAKTPQRNKSAEEWEEAALRAAADGGLQAVAVEPLARALGVTKGSFYWHFADRQALVAAAAKRWEKRDTEELLAALEAVADPRLRLERLFREAIVRSDAFLYLPFSSERGTRVLREAVRRVDTRRMQFLTRCFRDLGLSRADAALRSRLTYAAYVGLLHLLRREGKVSRASLQRFVRHALSTLTVPPAADI